MSKAKRKAPPPANPDADWPTFGFLPWAALGWLAFVVVFFLKKYPLHLAHIEEIPLKLSALKASVVLTDLWALLLLAALLVIAGAAGQMILSRFAFLWHSSLENLVFATGLGLGVLAYLVLGLGALQLFKTPVFWGLVGAGILLTVWAWGRAGLAGVWRGAREDVRRWKKGSAGWGPLRLLLCVFLFIALAMCFVPEVFYDAMVYHLGVPRWWLLEGGIKYYPAIHGQFPFTRQMLNTLGLALQGEPLAKLLHWSSGPLIVLTFAALGLRHGLPRAGLLGALAFFAMPMVDMNLFTTGIDVGMASFALLPLAAWINIWTDAPHAAKWAALSGAFAGLTFGSKYPGALCVVYMAGVLWGVTLWREKKLAASFKLPFIFGAAAFLVFLPWLVKNWVLTGNPLYPYFFGLFGGRDLIDFKLKMFHDDIGTGGAKTLAALLQSPWKVTFGQISSLSAPGLFPLGFAVFYAAGLIVPRLRRLPWYGPMLLYLGLYLTTVIYMSQSTRLAIPGLVVLCAAVGVMGAAVYERGPAVFRTAFSLTAFVCAIVSYDSTLGIIFQNYMPWKVLTGEETALQYSSVTQPGLNPNPAAALFEHARKNLPPGSKLLIIGDEKVSTCRMPFVATGVFTDSRIALWAKEAKTPAELHARLRREGVTHLVVNVAEAMRLKDYKMFRWDAPSLALLCDFWDRHVRLAHREDVRERYFNGLNNLLLLAVLPEDEAAKTPRMENNILLELEEEAAAPRSNGDWMARRTHLLEGLLQARPGVKSVEERLAMFRLMASADPSRNP